MVTGNNIFGSIFDSKIQKDIVTTKLGENFLVYTSQIDLHYIFDRITYSTRIFIYNQDTETIDYRNVLVEKTTFSKLESMIFHAKIIQDIEKIDHPYRVGLDLQKYLPRD